jgi:hypothetical protein
MPINMTKSLLISIIDHSDKTRTSIAEAKVNEVMHTRRDI